MTTVIDHGEVVELDGVFVKITPTPVKAGNTKVAEAEIHFVDGPLTGMRLMGFTIHERHVTDMVPVSPEVRKNRYTVLFPSRAYTVRGDKREYALLRPLRLDAAGVLPHARVIDLILRAFFTFHAA